MKRKIFSNVSSKFSIAMLNVDNIFYGSDIVIVICLTNKDNFIHVDVSNQSQVLESSVEKPQVERIPNKQFTLKDR